MTETFEMLPVTRGELREELTKLEHRTDLRFEAVDRRFEAVDGRFEAVDRRLEAIEARFDDLYTRLSTELAQHARAIVESVRTEIRAIDEARAAETAAAIRPVDVKYADLPARVARLERKVFPPKRKRRATG